MAGKHDELEYFMFGYNADNYGVLIHEPKTEKTACVDAGDAQAALSALSHKGWSLSDIWITHHHWDHTDGLADLKRATGAHVYGPAIVSGSKPVSGVDTHLTDGEVFSIGGYEVRVISTPGHTLDMINFFLPDDGVLFSGDTLFSLGCGRLFEGSPHQMFESLNKLKMLPSSTVIYCSHEYTSANARFAERVEPNNDALKTRIAEVERLISRGAASVPTTLGQELDANPFLRTDSAEIRNNLGMTQAADVDVFTKLRALKDNA